jgi:transcriptional regulator with XRE-family HTH domain
MPTCIGKCKMQRDATDMGFGSRIITVRKRDKLSQGELALKIGVHANVLGRYEREEGLPSIEVAAKIAQALGVSLDYLAGITDVEMDSTALLRVQEIASLPDEDKKQVFMVVDALLRDHKAKKAK